MNKLKNHKRMGIQAYPFPWFWPKIIHYSIYPTFPKPSGTVAVAPASRARVAQSLATAVPDARRCGRHSGATRQEALLEAHVFRWVETPKKRAKKRWLEGGNGSENPVKNGLKPFQILRKLEMEIERHPSNTQHWTQRCCTSTQWHGAQSQDILPLARLTSSKKSTVGSLMSIDQISFLMS